MASDEVGQVLDLRLGEGSGVEEIVVALSPPPLSESMIEEREEPLPIQQDAPRDASGAQIPCMLAQKLIPLFLDLLQRHSLSPRFPYTTLFRSTVYTLSLPS